MLQLRQEGSRSGAQHKPYIEINQLAYNLLFRAIEYEIIPVCLEHGVSVAPYSPASPRHPYREIRYTERYPRRARARLFSSHTRSMTRHGGPGAEPELPLHWPHPRDLRQRRAPHDRHRPCATLLRQPAVTTVIAGARSPEQIKANVEAAELVLPDDVVTALNEATEPLKGALGANSDMWESEQNTRIR